jgi:PAS domain-containing protein
MILFMRFVLFRISSLGLRVFPNGLSKWVFGFFPNDLNGLNVLNYWNVSVAKHELAWSGTTGYTFGMKTAISIPDKVFNDAERLSRRLKKSRSQIYAEAVTEYIARHDPEAVTEAMNRVCEEMSGYPDPAISGAARRTLEDVEW